MPLFQGWQHLLAAHDKRGLTYATACACLKCWCIVTKHLNKSSWFLPRDAMLAWSMQSSCVCLVTCWYCTKMAKRKITITQTPYLCPWTSFLMPMISAKFRRGHPNRGTKYRWVSYDRRFFLNQYFAISKKRCKIGTQLH